MPAFRNQGLFIFLMMTYNRILFGRAFVLRPCCPRRYIHSTSACQLNRFLFDPSEILNDDESSPSSAAPPKVLLPKDDYRTVHAAKTLGLKNGDTIRAGLVSCEEVEKEEEAHNGLWTDEATIEWIPEGKVKKAEVLNNGNPPGSLSVQLHNLSAPNTTSDQILVSLILALPRPLQLGRMLPMISQMGVDQLVLTQARKVPKDYFGSHMFRKPEVLRERLIEGLCQAGDVRLPKLHIVRNLPYFLDETIEELFPSDSYARVIAHPQRVTDTSEPLRMGNIEFPTTSPPRVVVAVGPEGGWEEPGELERFQELGFQQITLGTRTLRSDCAVVSLLSLAHEACHENRS
jgi:16S rRNA (uracil1498-N3)-methyltransferase